MKRWWSLRRSAVKQLRSDRAGQLEPGAEAAERGALEGEDAAVELGQVADDREAEAGARRCDKAPELKVGDKVVLNMAHRGGLPWRVVGRVREPFSPAGAYVSKHYIEELGGHGDATNSGRIALDKKDPDSLAVFRARLDQGLEAEGVRLASSSTKGDGRYGFDQHMLMIYVFFLVVAGILAVVGGLGQATTMSLNVSSQADASAMH